MRVYKTKFWVQVLINISILLIFIISGIIFFIFDKWATTSQRIIIIIGILFGASLLYILNDNTKIIIDDEKFAISFINIPPIGKRIKHVTLSMNWNEIGEFTANYVLYPETPIITLKPRTGISKKCIAFPMIGMPLELLRDILAHLPPDAKVHLYPYLKRKIEGKQTLFYVK